MTTISNSQAVSSCYLEVKSESVREVFNTLRDWLDILHECIKATLTQI